MLEETTSLEIVREGASVQKKKPMKASAHTTTVLQRGSVENLLGVVWDSSAGRLTFKAASDFLNCQEPIQLSERKILSGHKIHQWLTRLKLRKSAMKLILFVRKQRHSPIVCTKFSN